MKKTVLLVDDDAIQLKLTRAILLDAGFDVRSATGAVDALAEARRMTPDAIVSDVLMQDFDGFRLCELVRQEAALAHVPVVLVSAHFSDERDKSLAAAVGANDLAERSPDFHRELNALRRVLEQPPRATPPAAKSEQLYAERVSDQLNTLLNRARSADMRYRAIFENAHDAIALLELDGTVIEINRHGEELLGKRREELVGARITELATQGDRLDAVTLVRSEDTLRRVHFSRSIIELDGRKAVLAIGRDITREEEAARRLAASEEKYRRLVDNMLDTVWVSRLADGRILSMSDNVLALTGYTADELNRGVWASRIHPDDLPTVTGALATLAQRPMDLEYRFQHRNGSWRWFRARARATVRDSEHILDGIVSDVTERHGLEDQMRQAQKMEALGQLTGGVAHDFNNLLCVLLANSEILLRDLPDDDPRREDVLSMREASQRAAALTRQLLAFSRRQVLRPVTLDLSETVRGVEKLLRRVIGEDVALTCVAPKGVDLVLADPGQIEQVLMNLSVNARDAMESGGKLTIEASNVDVAEGASPGQPAGRYVRLRVADNGCGMPPEIQQRIFEPFFTTKPVGKGTGLGLATCFGIVKQSGGFISVSSAPGEGTTFCIDLPPTKAETSMHTVDLPVASQGGSETVLIIEDDFALRNTLTRALRRLGYCVLAADGAEAARRLYAIARDTIALIVSDVVLPGENGMELTASLTQQGYRGRVLYMSGYAARDDVSRSLSEPGVNVIQKPFPTDLLARTMRKLIDGATS